MSIISSSGYYGAVITAMVTPMQKISGKSSVDVAVNFEEAAKLAKYLVHNGSNGLVLSGTTGEAPTTHIDEKAELIRVVRNSINSEFPNQHVPIIAGTGSNDVMHAIRNTQIAYESGADAALIVAPYYSRPSQEGVYEYFYAVSQTTDIPIILYDVPRRCGVTIEPSTYAKLAKVPNIVGIKDATANIYRASKIKAETDRVRSDFGLKPLTLYCGDDSLLLGFLSIGASGIITVAGHLIGQQLQSIISKFSDGEVGLRQAQSEFQKVVWAIDLLNANGLQASYTKAAMQAVGILSERSMRLPNTALNDDEWSQVLNLVSQNWSGVA